jgi:hypothetical protein
VRAAEDNRTGPLPTLGEAIARPFTEAAERSSTVSKTGEGQSGMRTELVTLEVTGAPGWRVHVNGIDVESVRVFEEAHFDDVAQVAMERDAAIRERDTIRKQLPPTMQNCTIVFKECDFGHAWLTATNWAGHGCPWCKQDSLATERHAALLAKEAAIASEKQAVSERDAAIKERQRLEDRVSKVLKSSDSMWSRILATAAERDTLKREVEALKWRRLAIGELILESDQYLDTNNAWVPACPTSVGHPHNKTQREYRRLVSPASSGGEG